MSRQSRLPLDGLRVLAIEQYGAGPWGSLQLADLGAEVIKIETPEDGGDVGRYVPPHADGADSLFFQSLNRNKRSIALDLRAPAGRRIFEDLVVKSDVVFSNLRGDVPQKLGIRYSELSHLNPRIVCCSLSGFGMTGPRRDEPGYDYILQGLAGWMDLTGDPESAPTKSGLSLVDFSGGFAAAISILAGVLAAKRDGIGCDCDVSLFDTAVSLLNYGAAWYLNGGTALRRTANSAHPSLVPFQYFRASDGGLVIACAKEKFWRRLAVAVGRAEWLDDERFRDFEARFAHREELVSQLSEVLETQPVSHWVEVLGSAGVPVGPVNSVAQALDEPHVAARDLIVETDHPTWGTLKQVATPVRAGEARLRHRRAPRLHEDHAEILEDLLGFTAEDIHRARHEGAFGRA